MQQFDFVLIRKLVRLGFKPLKRAYYNDFIVINDFYLSSEKLCLNYLKKESFNRKNFRITRKKIINLVEQLENFKE